MNKLEQVMKVVGCGLALALLAWVFWNPSPKKATPRTPPSNANANVDPNAENANNPAFFMVTGPIETVRLRSETGRIYGPGEVSPGVYTIVSRTENGVQDHGIVVLEPGGRARIDCDQEDCRQFVATPK